MDNSPTADLTLVVIGIAVLLNLIFSTLVATMAEKRNQSWGLYFVVGLILGFVVAILFILLHDAIHRHWKAEDRHVLETAKEEPADPTVF